MNNSLNNKFVESALRFLDEDIKFTPVATYDEDGDCVEFLISPDSFYAARVDNLVTVYYSRETNAIVGSLIKGVSKYCREIRKKMPGFGVIIQEGSIMLGHLFLIRMLESDMENMQVLVYKKLQAVAEEKKIRTLLCKV